MKHEATRQSSFHQTNRFKYLIAPQNCKTRKIVKVKRPEPFKDAYPNINILRVANENRREPFGNNFHIIIKISFFIDIFNFDICVCNLMIFIT